MLYEIADYLHADGVRFKPEAYRGAAKFVEHYREALEDIFQRGGVKALEALPEIGASMAKRIGELVETGRLGYLEKLRKRLPTVMVKKRDRRRKLEMILPLAEDIVAKLKEVPGVRKIEIAGSLRRRTETVGDIDIVAASRAPSEVMQAFVNLPEVERVYSRGNTKTLVRLRVGIDADLRVVETASFGAALQYFTGPKEHSIATRQYARERGLKLNEYGLFRGTQPIAGKTEKEIYKALGLKCQKPEERTGELVEEK